MRSVFKVTLISLALILVGSCTSPVSETTPALTISSPTETAQPAFTPEPVETRVQIRLSTTSDWTELHLISGTSWSDLDLISSSEECNAYINETQLALDQTLERALDGETVEMIVQATFLPQESGRPVVLSTRRGDLGATEVEISILDEAVWVVVERVKSGQITGGLNDFKIEIPANVFFGEAELIEAPVYQVRDVESISPVIGLPQGTDGYAWWNDSIFYEIYVRSFFDSDGDGIGDIQGVIEKLDYLNDGDPQTTQDLGISGIWLMPIYPSPTNHGYNITDFKDVNPQLGTLEDLQLLLDEAHQRGIRVILDFMIGQTSNQHPWFLNSLNPGSSYRDWYIWEDHDPGYTGSWGQPVWTYVNGSYLYSTYSEYSPDLNMKNPEVKAEVFDAVRFWLEDIGVDGFRLDSAKHVIEEGEIQANSDSTHQFWKEFRPFYKAINPEAMVVGEVWEHTSVNAEYLQGDEFDLSFEFSLAYEIIKAVNAEDVSIINDQVALSFNSIPPHQYSSFLTNHDQDRLMDQLGFSQEKNKIAASLLLTAPGVPFLYYGEEVGLQGTGHDRARNPMQWSGEQNAGFSTGTPWQEVGFDWEFYNLSNQIDDPGSLFSHYRNLIQARNQHVSLRVGDPYVVSASENSLYSILRVSQEEAVLILINLGGNTLWDFHLDLENSCLIEGSYQLAPILGEGSFSNLEVDNNGGFSEYAPLPSIPPYATLILQLQ